MNQQSNANHEGDKRETRIAQHIQITARNSPHTIPPQGTPSRPCHQGPHPTDVVITSVSTWGETGVSATMRMEEIAECRSVRVNRVNRGKWFHLVKCAEQRPAFAGSGSVISLSGPLVQRGDVPGNGSRQFELMSGPTPPQKEKRWIYTQI